MVGTKVHGLARNVFGIILIIVIATEFLWFINNF